MGKKIAIQITKTADEILHANLRNHDPSSTSAGASSRSETNKKSYATTRNQPEPRYPHVYDAMLDAKATITATNNQKILLPTASSRKSFHDYEEITVDKMEKTDLVPPEKLVSIKDNFDRLGQIAFSGCSHLNPMQSVVYETAYKTNENMLVAAPTGSGKTNVAMMTILNELRNHFKPNSTELIDKNFSEKFKIIYIAPMKSLATEQTDNFSTRLKSLGIKTCELTGDMSMTEKEMSQTHIIVTTPEKWDVVTRKSKGDVDLMSLVRLLIIDEVHLLQSDRGPVLEALVARTLRYIESSQRMTRIIGLSATLPNYVDVATFLRVNPYLGLFYFDNRFRPVPLTQTFIGVRPYDLNNKNKCMDRICYDLTLQYILQQKQVMIFVHARSSTQKVAMKLREMIQLNNKLELFAPEFADFPSDLTKITSSAKNKLLKDLFAIGFGIHHAGMIRHDRLLVEKLFRMGFLKVLVCTATLAWGVNFPAHAVIIRGTEIYDSSAGKFVDVGLLDVMQIFGRAGRPQYDSDGHAIIMTALDKMDSYLKLLTNQTPIESNFIKHLTDNLNAEIVSGTVSNVDEGMEWLRYSYLNVRLAQNPLVYGFDQFEIDIDPSLTNIRRQLISTAARRLDEALMCRYNTENGQLEATDLGRIASHYYINYETIMRYNEILCDELQPEDILGVIGEAQEFQQIKYREEEANELDNLRRECHLPLAGEVIETTKGKVSCLLQAYISRAFIQSHSLISDLMYISQNATRIARGLFEYALKRSWPTTALNLLKICKMLELQCWDFNSPFRHFNLPPQVIARLEETQVAVDELEQMSVQEIAKLVHFPDKMGITIKDYMGQMPYVIVEGEIRTIKSNLLNLHISIQPYFKWNDRVHGKRRQSFWLWVVDEEITQQIYHSEHIKFNKEQVQKGQPIILSINIPLIDNSIDDGIMGQCIPNEYVIFVMSDEWIGCDYEFPIDCRKISLPSEEVAYTRVPMNLNQLPLSVIHNEYYASIFQSSTKQVTSTEPSLENEEDSTNRQVDNTIMSLQIDNFNLIQSQVFHPIFQSDRHLLICGPTGSGKTVLADLAILRVFKTRPKTQVKHKVLYITPIQSLTQLKYRDWQERFGLNLQRQLMILNDHTMFDEELFNKSEIIVSSAERMYVWLSKPTSEENLASVSLVIVDDMHLMSDKRGSHIELILSKLNYLKLANRRVRFRFIGILNTIANPEDLACWVGVKKNGVYNFHPTTARPIQLEIHISSFPERHYSPRMATMNTPIFKAILSHSSKDPVIIYVSSRKQCYLTALDLISCLVHYNQAYNQPWSRLDQSTLNILINRIQDNHLKLALEFGIGFLSPGLKFNDRKTIEELYLYNKIQILICTTNYAWENNFRARLVIVKGTEYYDAEAERFVDYPPADVMQMLGRAGRPNVDSTGIAILMIRDIYKEFYKKFLYEPFPVESDIMRADNILVKNFLMSDFKYQRPINESDNDKVDSTAEAPNNAKGPEEASKEKAVKKEKSKSSRKGPNLSPEQLKILEMKRHAINKLSHTLLARRLTKNPSYYGLNDGKSTDEFLSRYLAESKFLYED